MSFSQKIFNFPQNTQIPVNPKTVVYYFPTQAAGQIKKAEFLAAMELFDLIPVNPFGRDNSDAFQGKFDKYVTKNNPTYAPDEPDHNSIMLGLPVYGSIIFGNTDIHNKTGNTYTAIDGTPYSFNNLQVDNCICVCEQPTSIVEAKITGRPGRVKEYIGLDDWNISMTLIFDNPTDQAPKDFINAIWQIKQAQVAIPVTNYYLQLLGISFIVIKDISMPQEMGKYSSQTVTITAVSDIPLTDFLP